MCGKGVLQLAPGQITDDGELTLALGGALKGARSYPVEDVAVGYQAWVASMPFDIGHATSAWSRLKALPFKLDRLLILREDRTQ